MSEAEQCAEEHEVSIVAVQRRASLTAFALGLTATERAVSIVLRLRQNALIGAIGDDLRSKIEPIMWTEALVRRARLAEWMLLVVTAILFLRCSA